jgi:putative transposase
MRLLKRLVQRFLIFGLGIFCVWLIVFVVFETADRRLPWILAVSVTYGIAAYVVLPRAIRMGLKILQSKHAPSYTITGDGLPGDPVNVVLVGTVIVLRRQRPHRLRLLSADRLLWVWLYRLRPQVLETLVLVKPATVVKWHRQGFRIYWRWRSGRPGRPKTSDEIRDLIRRMSLDNPLWGAPRVHGELLKLGIEVSQATVGRYLPRRPKAPSPTWRSFLRNHMTDIAAVDMFAVTTATFRMLYAVIVLDHHRRRVIHFEVTQNPTQAWLARQITEAFPWDTAPRFLLRDRDTSYGLCFQNRVQAMGIEEVLTAPRSPWQNPYAERIIGSIRRECLDYVIIFNEAHLRRVLSCYFRYYHRSRTHLSLNKDCPDPRRIQLPSAGKIAAFPEVGGLHCRYERRAA